MKLTGNLKKQVDQTESREEARSLIEKAGVQLTDGELDQVAGGWGEGPMLFEIPVLVKCDACGNMIRKGYPCLFCSNP